MRIKVIPTSLVIIPLVVFYAAVLFFGVNIPQQDDYDSILVYLIDSQSLSDNGLFAMHVSHRIVLTRLLASFSLVLGNGVELRLLIYIGALSLLGVFVALYRSTVNVPNRRLVVCMVCLSLFSLFHWSNMVWATASVQNYVGLFVATTCFYLFEKQASFPLAGAIALGLIAPYINSNGLLLLPILFIWAVASPVGTKRSRVKIMAISCAILISFYIFFFAIEAPSIEQIESVTSITQLFTEFAAISKAYLIASAGYLHYAPLAISAGLVVNLYFLLLIKFRYYQKNRLVFYTYLFMLLSVALVAFFRFELGTDQLIASRYQIYTLLINALIAISFFELELPRYLPFKLFKQLVLVMYALLYISSLYYLGNLYSEKSKITQGIVEWQTGDGSSLYHPDTPRAEKILDRAIKAGVYQVPDGI